MEPTFIVSGSTDKAIKIWSCPKKLHAFQEVGNLRPILEVLKFLNPKEVIRIARVNKQFYEASFHSEVLTPIFRETKVLRGHNECVWSVAVPKEKPILVSSSRDSTIRLWSLATSLPIQVLKGHTGEVFSVAISNEGDFIVSGGKDKTLRVWSLASGLTTQVLKGHSRAVRSVAISSKDEYIVSGSYDKTLRVWSLTTGEVIRVLQGHSDSVLSVAISKTDQ